MKHASFRVGTTIVVRTFAIALACQPLANTHRPHARESASRTTSLIDPSLLTLTIDNARLMLVDGTGARAGLDPDSGKQIHEIPRSSVSVDAIDDAVTGERAESFTVTVRVENPAAGAYRLVVVGQGRASTTLIVSAWASDGTAQPALRVPVVVTGNTRTEFRLHFVPTPGGRVRLESLSPGGSR